MNKLLEKFRRHEVSIGTFTQLGSTIAVEALGRTGLDYVLIDRRFGHKDVIGIYKQYGYTVTKTVTCGDEEILVVMEPAG